MSDKPSLYVVERKEVVILVVLFVLVTVLSFTVGVRYGETIGRKFNHEEVVAKKEVDGTEVGGVLGEKKEEPVKDVAKDSEKKEDKASESPEKAALASAKPEVKAEKKDAPEAAADEGEKNLVPKETAKAVEANSDESLLTALKDAGVEPPQNKSSHAAKLPQEVKALKPGVFVIQVGSHPTKHEADEQLRRLKENGLEAQILSPIKDKQGEWFRVVIGSYKNKNDAEKSAKQFKAKGLVHSYFVRRFN